MEPTLQNKTKFFAQYYGVSARVYVNITESGIPTEVNYSALHPESVECSFLKLKDVYYITEEDRKHLSVRDCSCNEYGYSYNIGGLVEWTSEEIDYLRSRGYAMEYMGVAVSKLIEWNWIKLKEYDK